MTTADQCLGPIRPMTKKQGSSSDLARISSRSGSFQSAWASRKSIPCFFRGGGAFVIVVLKIVHEYEINLFYSLGNKGGISGAANVLAFEGHQLRKFLIIFVHHFSFDLPQCRTAASAGQVDIEIALIGSEYSTPITAQPASLSTFANRVASSSITTTTHSVSVSPSQKS